MADFIGCSFFNESESSWQILPRTIKALLAECSTAGAFVQMSMVDVCGDRVRDLFSGKDELVDVKSSSGNPLDRFKYRVRFPSNTFDHKSFPLREYTTCLNFRD